MFAPAARAALGPAPSPPLTGTCSTRTGSWASRGTTGRNTHMGGGGAVGINKVFVEGVMLVGLALDKEIRSGIRFVVQIYIQELRCWILV